jgi:polysaccharide export outer membrane protein
MNFSEGSKLNMITHKSTVVAAMFALIAGCASNPEIDYSEFDAMPASEYRIGPGDNLEIFVWRNPEISTSVPVRPDGKISTPLVEDMLAVGKTPTELSRDMEVVLSEFIKTPKVSIIVTGFVGTFNEQIRVVGMAGEAQALSYRENMTLLDVMIEVGGLAEGAAGNRAKIIRKQGGQDVEIPVRINDLLNKGNMASNLKMRPGDILIIPESRF